MFNERISTHPAGRLTPAARVLVATQISENKVNNNIHSNIQKVDNNEEKSLDVIGNVHFYIFFMYVYMYVYTNLLER